MAQSSLTARIQILDTEGNVIGTQDFPMVVDSEPLRAAIEELTKELKRLSEMWALTHEL